MGKSNEILNTFGECTRALIELLHENPKLEMVEQMFLDSHLALIRTAYNGWKRRNSATQK